MKTDFREYKVWDPSIEYPRYPDIMFPESIEKYIIQDSRKNNEIAFLHDTSVTIYENSVFAAWYNSTEGEILGKSMIRGRRSYDSGINWSEPIYIAGDDDNKGYHYVPVNLHPHTDGNLYALISRMVSHDRPVSYDIHRMNKDGSWIRLNEIAGCFISNTAPIMMDNGNYIISGRIDAERGGHPEIPAVLLSQGSDITAPWQEVPFFDINNKSYIYTLCPETTIWVEGEHITAFTRTDSGEPHYIFESFDYGLSWSEPMLNLMPITISKIAAGILHDGRRYLLYNANVPQDSKKLTWKRPLMLMAVASSAGKEKLSKVYKILEENEETINLGGEWSYPCPYEDEGILYISVTNQSKPRNAVLVKIPVDKL